MLGLSVYQYVLYDIVAVRILTQLVDRSHDLIEYGETMCVARMFEQALYDATAVGVSGEGGDLVC